MAREMKNTRFYWMGEIPVGWELIKLGYLCSLKGRIGWKGLRSDEFLENSYAYLVTGQDFVDDTVNWQACYQIEKGRYDEDPYIQLREGDLLVTKDGTIGKIAKVRSIDKPACLNSGIFVLRQTMNRFDQGYLYWQLYSSLLTDYNLFVNSGASTIQHLYQNVFERMPLIVPSFSEQLAIADFLDAKCAEIDGLLADLEAEVKTLVEYKKSIIAETVTRGLNPDVPMKQSGIPWAEEIPAHWATVRGKYAFRLLQRPVKEDDGVVTCFRDGQVTLRSNRREDGFTMSDKEYGYQGIEPGDLVVHGMDGFAGSIGISDSRGKGTPVLNVLDSDNNKRYLMYYLRNMAYGNVFLSLSTGIRVRSCDLSWKKLGEIRIVLPPIEEQNAIAEYIDHKLEETQNVIATKLTQIETLKSYKASLIYEYVTGKKQVI